MEVTFDDLATDWDWVNTHADGKFKRLDAEEYPPLHQYILDRKSTFVCHLNSDGTAGGVEPHDSLDRDRGGYTDSEHEWHGGYDVSLGYEDEKCKLKGCIEGTRKNMTVRGQVDVDQKGNVSAGIGIKGSF